MADGNFQRPGISPPPRDRDGARRKALSHFAVAEQRDTEVRKEIVKARDAVDAKTAQLRALRLAKEEADRAAGEIAPAPKPRAKKIKTFNVA